MAKKQKLPELSMRSKILSFDIEANGLHGQAFAVGGVVLDVSGKIIDEFKGRIEIDEKIDEWVEKNVLPSIADIKVNYKSYQELKDAFWQWYLEAEAESDYVVLNNGYPVEYKFLLECQKDDLENRYWQHPFPILDLTSLILQAGKSKKDFIEEIFHDTKRLAHNPLDDAVVAALAAIKAFRLTGQIR